MKVTNQYNHTMKRNLISCFYIGSLAVLSVGCNQVKQMHQSNEPFSISGIYPHLAVYNNEGECGIGAVVPWQNSLWVITYGPHLPFGSSDKLYEVSEDLTLNPFSGSIGGTPANRMIHAESNQLFIGPYAIDSSKNVRVIPYEKMPGRHTGLARHLTNPKEKIYLGTMEEGFYEIDVNTLDVKELYTDGNVLRKQGKSKSVEFSTLLPGYHGKGLYSGQGVLVYSNNGEEGQRALVDFRTESGSLSEWDGKDWTVIRRNQFVEVTGPGGINGNPSDSDPIWATGWDSKSVLLGVRDNDKWSFYRLPKVSNSYDGAHGWNTEWPRIRNVGTAEKPDYLMTMHGLFWQFPETFSSLNSAGIRPRSAYLKVIGDFTRWNNQLVFGCDDSAQKEFLNKRSVKFNLDGAGQSHSNLWFTSTTKPDELGVNTAVGSVWYNDTLQANTTSDPFLFSGWEYKSVWLKNEGNQSTKFSFMVDKDGRSNWEEAGSYDLKPNESMHVDLNQVSSGEWIKVKTSDPTIATVTFTYVDKNERSVNQSPRQFDGIASITNNEKSIKGLLYALGDDKRKLGVLSGDDYYELDEKMQLTRVEDEVSSRKIKDHFQIDHKGVTIDEGAIVVVDDKNNRWRLPLGEELFNDRIQNKEARLCREVATERDLFHCGGTFYELPAENAGGFSKMRPISSHKKDICDFTSYRGMLLLTGIDPNYTGSNKHIIYSEDKNVAVWAGAIDDLWEMGRPTGKGGPWVNVDVQPQTPSDPYLIARYADKSLQLSHKSSSEISFIMEVDPTGDGKWLEYKRFIVKPNEVLHFDFEEGFEARWIRFIADKAANVKTWLEYK